jgi:hypothetical protein
MCHYQTLATVCGAVASPQLIEFDIARVRVGVCDHMETNREKGMAQWIRALLLDRCCKSHSVQGWKLPLPEALMSLFASYVVRFAGQLTDLSLSQVSFGKQCSLTQA